MTPKPEGNAVRSILWILALTTLILTGCEAEEAPRIELPIVADGSLVAPTTTDLGYVVELSEARMVLSNVLFTVRGEAHAARRLSDWLIAPAYAHPGHFHGGEISGEMPGRFVVDWIQGHGQPLGTATLLAGNYESANFTFAYGTPDDGLPANDALLEHTAILRGVAKRIDDGQETAFVALIQANKGRDLIGAPFEIEISGQTQSQLGFRLATTDPYEGDSLFDGIDFAELAQGKELITFSESNDQEEVRTAYFRLRRTFQTHDHFEFVAFDD